MPKRSLDTYRSKRDPDRTPEPVPAPGPLPTGDDDTFVIQEHHASALHWDFRLERDGVLVSWALPKGLPLTPKDNHLAVPTEDHPLDYASFEGEIEKGQYGGGQVTIWDRGRYDTEKWSDREVKVVLHGARSEGRYALFATGRNWMIHRMDPPAKGFQHLPAALRPMTATRGRRLPRSKDWLFDARWDGSRLVVAVDGGRPTVWDSKGTDVTGSFPELRAMAESLGSHQALIDGVMVGRAHPMTFMVIDLLHLDGRSLLERPLTERRSELDALALDGPGWHVSPLFDDGPAVRDAARQQGLSGLVAKRAGSTYDPGGVRDDWREVTV